MLAKYDEEQNKQENSTSKANEDISQPNDGEKTEDNKANQPNATYDNAHNLHSDELSEEEQIKRIKKRSQTTEKKKFDTSRLIKPTYSSLKRGRVLPRDPKTNHTVSDIKPTKVFSPCNPREAKMMIERNLFLNNLDDINLDLPEEAKTNHSMMYTGMGKTGIGRCMPNSRKPNDIKKASAYINSSNGFDTFLTKNSEIPRLSVLESYKDMSRIMTNSFIKAKEIEKRFKNNALSEEEFKKKKEEEENNRKLTKILKQMNSPRDAFITGKYPV